MTERRSSERFPTILKGLIVRGDSSPSVECIVRNLSTTGAQISLLYPAEIPLQFELQISEEGASAKARLIWTTGKEAGVVFTD
jgi:hypothetical protein